MTDWLKEQIGTSAEAQELVNAFHWFLSVEPVGEQWQIRSGERVVYTGASREHVDAFLYGMALAYKGMSPRIYMQLFRLMLGTESPPIPLELEKSESEDEV